MFKQRLEYMKKREKLRKKTPNKFYAYSSDFNQLNKILTNAKGKIKNYFKTLVYLTPKELEILENVNNFRLDENSYTITAIFKKTKSNQPIILYLTKKQIKDIKDAKAKNFDAVFLSLSKNQILETFNETQKINKKLKSLFDRVLDEKDDFKIMQERKKARKADKKEKYKQFIADLMKYSSKTPMLGNRKQKVGKVIKSLLEER